MGALSPWHIAILVLVFVLLFGAKRLPDSARSLGRSLRIFKSEMQEMGDDKKQEPKPDAQAPVQQLPPAQQPVQQAPVTQAPVQQPVQVQPTSTHPVEQGPIVAPVDPTQPQTDAQRTG